MSLIGTDFTAYVAPTQAELDEETAAQVRSDRDYKLLTEVDPLVTNPLRWAELTSDKPNRVVTVQNRPVKCATTIRVSEHNHMACKARVGHRT